MVDIGKSAAIEPVIGTDRGKRDDLWEDDEERARRKALAERTPRQIQDVAQVMGIPVDELTPRVQEALQVIVGEFDRTRAELERERARAVHFKELCDRHASLPVLNRRAFLREFTRLINRAAQTRTVSTLAIVRVCGLEGVFAAFGRGAAEGVLGRVAQRLASGVRVSDVVAGLDGGDFAVILSLSAAAEAADKIAALCDAAADDLKLSGGSTAGMSMAWGIAPFAGDADPGQVIVAADTDLRARMSQPG